jgi:hypothetical protein
MVQCFRTKTLQFRTKHVCILLIFSNCYGAMFSNLNACSFEQNICCVIFFLYIADQQKGLRRLSHKGFQGALTIALKRDEDGYCLPYQVMTLLTDVDALIMKWRCK